MAQLGHLTRPVVGTAASLHHDDRRTLLGHQFAKMLTGEPPPELDFSRQQIPCTLENAFRQIDPDHCITCHAAILHPLDLTRSSPSRMRQGGRAATTPSIQREQRLPSSKVSRATTSGSRRTCQRSAASNRATPRAEPLLDSRRCCG